MGNPSLGFRYSRKGPVLDFSTGVNGAFPVASSAKGLSTGRVTFDWDNHFAHGFDLFTPFFDFGVANSVPDTRFLKRPYTSLGTVAHFEGGSEMDLGDKFSVSASGYYILPWGHARDLRSRQEKLSWFNQRGREPDPGRRDQPRTRLQSHPLRGFERWLQLQCIQRR